MSTKENLFPTPAGGELSAEQRTRISHSFKAAKALFDRKRQRIDSPSARVFSDLKCTFGDEESSDLVRKNAIRRQPLSEIDTNVSTPVSSKRCLLSNNFDGGIVNGVEIETRSVSSEKPTLKTCSTLSVWADEFDESILEEIDALCEQVSAKKHGKEDREVTKVENGIAKEFEEAALVPGLSTFNEELCLEKLMNSECETRTLSDSAVTKEMPDEYAKYINSLSDRQREAACYEISTPLMIVAGPGSGKTSTMVGRVLMLLNEGINPANILAMTFTTAATAEMRERIGKVAGKQAAKQLVISTFHSFSLELCRTHAEKLGRTTDFLLYGHGQQRKAVVEAVRLMEEGRKNVDCEICVPKNASHIKSPKHFKDQSKKWMKFVAQAKAAGREPEHFHKVGNVIGATILQNYNNILKSCNALDYHDLISCSVKLLTDFPEVYDICQESWKAIIIDEFQDTSAMQYSLLRILATHKRITVIGDEDQSIFSFNGADVCGFDSFRKDFPLNKEVRLNKNYRSTGCITEAASVLIQHNLRRCNRKDVITDNCPGSKITIKECCNEEAQCAFVVDKILEIASDGSSAKSYNKIAVLFRRQVTGRIFQTAFRDRKIPFNVHGVAFYRKKVVRAIISMLTTALPGSDDGPFRRVFKALMPFDKEDKKKVIEHIDKVSTVRKCSFIAAARDIFNSKISGTFTRSQLTQGRKVLQTVDMISKLIHREHSISTVITSVANMIPQKYLLDQRAVLDVDDGKMLNEDNDLRSVLQHLLDDVSLFLTTVHNNVDYSIQGTNGCAVILKAFIDYVSGRERENFRMRKCDNEDSVTLTTIHQSKGLEWDTVFIVKANESEIPLLHENNGMLNENGASLEEERRLFYVAMTRARKKLIMLYVIMDSSWQVLQPSRFLREIPYQLLEAEEDLISFSSDVTRPKKEVELAVDIPLHFNECPDNQVVQHASTDRLPNEAHEKAIEAETFSSSNFLKRFGADQRAVVSHIFHQWAKKPAFHDPKRLLNKVGFVVDERLRAKKCTHKDVLRELKSCLQSDDAYHFAISVLRWQQIPADTRAHLMREKQEHFQKLRIENAMGSSEPTPKQITYLQSLGCTIVPSSRLHASRLIEEYKSL